MRTYMIAYDLANPNAKKHALAREIMTLGTRWARPLEQTWYVSTLEDSGALNERLAWMLGEEDGLVVQEVAADVVLSNTTLRWFRTKQDDTANVNVVPFASSTSVPAIGADAAVAA
ncbi:MAG: hypothetical protein AAFV45_11105 [Pseudomonadota bacterium]